MKIDKDLLQYCKDKGFPVEEMDAKDFKAVENMLDFQFYKLGKEVLNALKKIEHRKKSCKNFKCK